MSTAPDTLDATAQARLHAFEALGFESTQALILATIRDDGAEVEIDDVRRLLDQGCPHDLALRIVV